MKKFKLTSDPEKFREKLISFWYENKTRIRDLNLPRKEVIEQAKKLELYSPDELFSLQLTMYRTEKGKAIVGEKTPRHILSADQILDTYPKARFISLFRDPRAAAYSEIKAEFGSPSVFVTTRRWKKYVQKHLELRESLSDEQYKMLRYKDLIADPEHILTELCTFLGVSYDPAMMKYYQRDESGFAEGESAWKKDTLKPIQNDKNEEWKKSLNSWQVHLIEDTAGPYLEKMGYNGAGRKQNFLHKLLFKSLDFSRSVWSTLTYARYEGYRDPASIKFS